jgi:hypothetical protein
MYEELFALQDGKCAACGRPPKDKNLNLDHEHFTVDAFRGTYGDADKWVARATFKDGRWVSKTGATRAVAIARTRSAALPLSVRGLLCPGRYAGCNRKLGRIDDINWLKAVLHYLQNPPSKKILDKLTESW